MQQKKPDNAQDYHKDHNPARTAGPRSGAVTHHLRWSKVRLQRNGLRAPIVSRFLECQSDSLQDKAEDARGYVSQIGSKIVLIDGERLSHLMVEHDVGVSTVSLYPVKKIDADYFDESI